MFRICAPMLSLILILTPIATYAQIEGTAPIEEEAAIQVEGQSKPKRASVNQFREAQAAFQKLRPSLAPAASLMYEIRTANKSGVTEANIGSVRLSLLSNGDRIPIEIDGQHRFVMPDLRSLTGDYRLFANVGKKPIYIAPRIFSPGTSETERRLGDIRLECQTGWAYYKSEISIMWRAGFGLIGGCGSKKIALYYRLPRPVARVTVSDRGKSVALVLSPRFPNAYRAPIYDKSLSNEARISIAYK
jgi:hypothetical protein